MTHPPLPMVADGHPGRSHRGGFSLVTGMASEKHVSRVEQCAAVFELADVVAIDQAVGPTARNITSRVLAPAPALSNEPRDKDAPLGAEIDGIGSFLGWPYTRRRSGDAGLEGV
jgi:hypothetical protein